MNDEIRSLAWDLADLLVKAVGDTHLTPVILTCMEAAYVEGRRAGQSEAKRPTLVEAEQAVRKASAA
jgi:hypothetical protein